MKYEKFVQVACSVIVVVALLGVSYIFETSANERLNPEIVRFIESRGEKSISIERCFISTGPFWSDTNTRIYCAKSDKNVFYWFKYSWIGHDCIYLDQNGNYTELK